MNNLIRCWSQRPLEDIVYFSVFLCVCIRVFVRMTQQLRHLHYDHFQYQDLWAGLLAVACFHLLLIGACFLSSRSKQINGMVLYFGLLLSLYAACLLLSCCGIFFLQGAWLWGLVIASGLFLFRQGVRWPGPLKDVSALDILIILWLVHSLLLFLDYNFDPARHMYQDEGSFWVSSAQQVLDQGIFKAQLAFYPGGGLHPFGVPFIVALPLLLMPATPSSALFFMPILVIIALFFFLQHIKSQRWVFLFFFLALFITFNNHSWMGVLLYQLVYGEGISTVILLWFTHELLVHGQYGKKGGLWLAGFCIGLLALTKSPLSLIFLPLLVVLLMKNSRGHQPLRLCIAVMLAWAPSLIWKCFVHYFDVPYISPPVHFNEIVSRIFHPNANLLRLSYEHMWQNAQHLIFFGLLSLGLWGLYIRKLYEGLPVLLLLISVVLYYAYYYDYGTVQGSFESFSRYIMPCSLALFWLGALAFNELIRKIQGGNMPGVWKIVCMLALNAVIIYRIF